MDVLDVAGAPRERGRAPSEALRERIAVGLELWREHARPAGRTEVMEAVGPAVVAGATAHVTHLRRPA